MTNQTRTATSTWQRGTSGNRNGRPKGTGEVAKLRAAIADRLPELLDSLMANAIAGDVSAARLLLERTIPPLRPVEMNNPVPIDGDTIADQGRAVLTAIASGGIAPAAGASIIGALALLAKIDDAGEQERSIALILTALKRRGTT